MPPPYDSVISIGGQSFVDGVWRLFGPSLEGLTNPLPLALPGFTNAEMRITRFSPLFPGIQVPWPGLQVIATVELSAEAPLSINAGVGNPVPGVAPVAVDLTPTAPLTVLAMLDLNATGFDQLTPHSVLLSVKQVLVALSQPDTMLASKVAAALQQSLDQTVKQLGITAPQTPIAVPTVAAMLAPLEGVVRKAFRDALLPLLGETGRLLYPPSLSASCAAHLAPNRGDVQLAVAPDNSYVLHLGFGRTYGIGSSDITAFPQFAPSGSADTRVTVGNTFLIRLMCCLVMRLPAFTMPEPVVLDIGGGSHLVCCKSSNVTLDLGLFALTGDLSLCLDGVPGDMKRVTLIGHFAQTIVSKLPRARGGVPAVEIALDFTLPLWFDLDDAASITNLRVYGSANVTPRVEILGPLAGAILAAGVILFIFSAVGVVALMILFLAVAVIESLLGHAARTILREASLLSSPVAIPTGVFEAFGSLVPVDVTFDDYTADSVLQTPTSPWALLPRISLNIPKKPAG